MWTGRSESIKVPVLKIDNITVILWILFKGGYVILEVSPIHSTSLEMSEVSSETDMLLISVPQQTDAAIFW